jgi:hypothetical protein
MKNLFATSAIWSWAESTALTATRRKCTASEVIYNCIFETVYSCNLHLYCRLKWLTNKQYYDCKMILLYDWNYKYLSHSLSLFWKIVCLKKCLFWTFFTLVIYSCDLLHAKSWSHFLVVQNWPILRYTENNLHNYLTAFLDVIISFYYSWSRFKWSLIMLSLVYMIRVTTSQLTHYLQNQCIRLMLSFS